MNQRDVERLTRTVTERAAALVLYARQWLDGTSAEDAVQEALVALLTLRESPCQPMAWMYRAVRNAAIDAARAAQRRRRHERRVGQARVGWFVPQSDALLDAQTAEQSLRQLNHEHREVVVLRIWGDLTFAEIATVLQLSVSTAYDRYQAALRELRKALEKPCPTKAN
jgi:RNA polymerase sigma factor (sigma-70 family)